MAKKKTIENEVTQNEVIPTSEFNLAVSEAIKIATQYKNITNTIQDKVNDIFSNYLWIGTNLKSIDDEKLYQLEEYESVYEYASQKFNLSQTTVHNIMSIATKFSDGNGKLLNQFKDYTFSTLVELLSVNELDLDKYSPVMTVKEIRSKKLEQKINQLINLSTSPIGSVSQVIERVKAYPLHTELNNLDARLTYEIQKENYEQNPKEWYKRYSYSVTFTIDNLQLRIKTFKFVLTISEDGFMLSTDTQGFWERRKVIELPDVDKFMKDVCKDIYDESVIYLKRKSSSNDKEPSPGFAEFSRENKWNFINPILNEVAKNIPYKAYYEHINNTEMIVYKDAKKNKKKNPPLFKIHYPDDLNKIQVVDLEGKMLDEFSEVLKKRDEFVKLISDTIADIVKVKIDNCTSIINESKSNKLAGQPVQVIDYEPEDDEDE